VVLGQGQHNLRGITISRLKAGDKGRVLRAKLEMPAVADNDRSKKRRGTSSSVRWRS
jgi:hypothetical protein